MKTKFKYIEEDDLKVEEEPEPEREWKKYRVRIFVAGKEFFYDFTEKDGATIETAKEWVAKIQAMDPTEWVVVDTESHRVSQISSILIRTYNDRS